MNKVKKKVKFERICYNCKSYLKCIDRYRKNAKTCENFEFCATCKSI